MLNTADHKQESIEWLEGEDGQASLEAWPVTFSSPEPSKMDQYLFRSRTSWFICTNGLHPYGIPSSSEIALALVVADRTARLAGSGVCTGSQFSERTGWSAWFRRSDDSDIIEFTRDTQVETLTSLLAFLSSAIPDAPLLKREE